MTTADLRRSSARLLPHTPKAFYRTALMAFFFIMGVIFASWAIRIPDVKAALHLSDAELGGLLFGAPLGQLLAIVPSAWLIGRIRSRRTIILGMLLMPTALVSLSLAAGHVSLFVCLLFFGFADNMLNIALNSQAVGVETLYGRSIMATFHGWPSACWRRCAAGHCRGKSVSATR